MLRGILIPILAFLLAGATSCAEPTKSETGIPQSQSSVLFTIEQLEPKVLPYVFTENGTWIVKPVRINEKDKTRALQKLKKTMRKISETLKPFPSHRDGEPIVPKIKITPITIEKQGRSVKTLGWYDIEYNAIVLTWDIIKAGDEGLRYAFSHELGHWVWCRVLSEKERREYRKLIFAGNDNVFEGELKDPGMDRELLIQEWFAEDFRLYACGVPDYRHVLQTTTEKSPGRHIPLIDFFSRFRNDEARNPDRGVQDLFPQTSGKAVNGYI